MAFREKFLAPRAPKIYVTYCCLIVVISKKVKQKMPIGMVIRSIHLPYHFTRKKTAKKQFNIFIHCRLIIHMPLIKIFHLNFYRRVISLALHLLKFSISSFPCFSQGIWEDYMILS